MSVILATAGLDHTIKFWDAVNLVSTGSIQVGDSQINALCISPEQRYIAAACNPTIKLYSLMEKPSSHVNISFEGHEGNVTAIGFSADSTKLYSCSEDKTVKFWDMNSPTCTQEFHFENMLNCAVLHPNQNELFVGDNGGNISVLDLRTSMVRQVVTPQYRDGVHSLALDPTGGLIVSCHRSGNINFFTTSNSPEVKARFEHVALTKSNKEEQTFPQLKHLQDLPDLKPTVIQPLGLTISGTNTWEHLASYKAHDGYVLCGLISPDGKHLATSSSDSSIKLWDISGNNDSKGINLKNVFSSHTNWVWDLAFSLDSMYLVSASSDTTARLWDLNRGSAIRRYQGHDKGLTCLALYDPIYSRR
eukprot:TRINITY_DN2502_c0_g1_i1.p1 TRINITY_DN2502_c0_g1~~TRINITY_DN2502_c0_g1_i1.p1  ORF type:complete len:361 (+),score=70.35 TRINITY_DN2502_c0_g1_i1:177-1259(+)